MTSTLRSLNREKISMVENEFLNIMMDGRENTCLVFFFIKVVCSNVRRQTQNYSKKTKL